jgi:hypothetical protein
MVFLVWFMRVPFYVWEQIFLIMPALLMAQC